MKRTIPYALLTGAALIAYFLLMKLFGLETNFYLRIFNLVIMIAGLFFLYRNTFLRGSHDRVGYLQGLLMGGQLTLIAVGMFIVFLGIYIKFLDPEFMKILGNTGLWATSNISITQAVLGILIEGLASGFILSFVLMQYFKASIPSRDSA
ncbi:DUF4199 domain-containing protein [Cryomorpha ignava]|uniref:DUF4199 domain-containing protein n=1 Tax=Cryomorpha ignava TaxID=101383 RepID=A0A7K3WVL0_9FLAO|nr:DUF4199 domain-containing protein [Cryomorpha ignava]NEN25578.1 DUF4199 domain-containing protein [Cryomorpha ignava]